MSAPSPYTDQVFDLLSRFRCSRPNRDQLRLVDYFNVRSHRFFILVISCSFFVARPLVHFARHRYPLQIMPAQFYHSTAKTTQGVRRTHKRVQLTKEARAAINARRREASDKFQRDLEKAWTNINEATETLASTHHKSIRRVQSELHMGQNIAWRRRSKNSLWNAFCWKKGISLKAEKETGGDESK